MPEPINNFIQRFDGGSKPNLYRVKVQGAELPAGLNDLHFFCRAAQLPSSIIGEIPVPFLGRFIKVPGDRVYDDWMVSVINTEDMNLRKVFESWNESYNQHSLNIPTVSGSPYSHMKSCSASVEQLDRKGNVIHKYTFFNLYPRDVSAVDLAFDQNDTISEFSVSFAYSHFERK